MGLREVERHQPLPRARRPSALRRPAEVVLGRGAEPSACSCAESARARGRESAGLLGRALQTCEREGGEGAALLSISPRAAAPAPPLRSPALPYY